MMADNGSTDGSVRFVRERYPSVEIIENGENLGVAGARNIAMKRAFEKGAGWVHHLDNDIRVDPDLLTELMSAALADPRIGILGAKIYYHAKPSVLWYAGGNVNYFTGMITHRGIRTEDRGQFDSPEDTRYVVGCSFLIGRHVVDAVGPFDLTFTPFYTEDSDMCARALRAGFRVVYVPSAKLWHRVSTSSGGVITPKRVTQKIEYNLIYFKRYARWYHWITIPICIGALTLVYLVREIFKGNFAVIGALWRGFGRAVGRLMGGGKQHGARGGDAVGRPGRAK
jgi:GT2 family glycosyltransferase